MWDCSRLRRYISALPQYQIFTTRELIPYGGKRSALDAALSRMVARGYLERLCRGVFRIFRSDNPTVAPREIAEIKLRAFAKRIASIAPVTAMEEPLLLIELEAESNSDLASNEVVFATNGRSSRFMFGDRQIVVRGLAMRKLALGETKVGLGLRRIWLAGELAFDMDKLFTLCASFGREDWWELGKSRMFLPWWISDQFANYRPVRNLPC